MVPTPADARWLIAQAKLPIYFIHFTDIQAQNAVFGKCRGSSWKYLGEVKCKHSFDGKAKIDSFSLFMLPHTKHAEIKAAFPGNPGFKIFVMRKLKRHPVLE
jgi:hypothetical protein